MKTIKKVTSKKPVPRKSASNIKVLGRPRKTRNNTVSVSGAVRLSETTISLSDGERYDWIKPSDLFEKGEEVSVPFAMRKAFTYSTTYGRKVGFEIMLLGTGEVRIMGLPVDAQRLAYANFFKLNSTPISPLRLELLDTGKDNPYYSIEEVPES